MRARAGVHAIRQATARRFAVSAAAASNGTDEARGEIALVYVFSNMVLFLLGHSSVCE